MPEVTSFASTTADAPTLSTAASMRPATRWCVSPDADSILDPSALEVMVRPFLEDPERVVAVGGTVRVGNSGRVEDGQMIEPRVPRG